MSGIVNSVSSSTARFVSDSSTDSGHVAAIIVCMLVGLILLCYAIYRLTKRYCPNMLLAISPQDTSRPLARSSSRQHIDDDRPHTEMAAHEPADSSALSDKKAGSDSYSIDMPSPLSVNEQWTVRDAPAEDEDTA